MTAVTFSKPEGSTKRLTFSLSNRLLSGESVQAITAFSIDKETSAPGADFDNATPVSVGGLASQGQSIQAQVSAGQPGVLYLITFTVTGSLGTVVTAAAPDTAHIFIGPWDYGDGEAHIPSNAVPPHNHLLADVTDAEPRLVPVYGAVLDGWRLTLDGGILVWAAPAAGSGDMVGPNGGVVDGELVTWDGTGGKNTKTGGPVPMEFVAAPANYNSTGTPKQVAWDGIFFYLCYATNLWWRIIPERAGW